MRQEFGFALAFDCEGRMFNDPAETSRPAPELSYEHTRTCIPRVLGSEAICANRAHASREAEAVVNAVAARDQNCADAFSKKHGIAKAYGYRCVARVLDDPDYNPLPNCLHSSWTMEALAAGKHVLLEKSSADTADETRSLTSHEERPRPA
ncbi:hypothetical protein FA95DRAFT_903776 [Auriscalpium vulgare]|uniref:Uncharacterized protein n=1 Tax=Auriscalpium vulgare TaxID=40419 RepID=A0ACB8R7W9_9AGAM|nr:hypothetical protein FA95DRAFT_903776 [Auriscalpium vulgare]